MSSIQERKAPVLTFEICVIEPQGYGIKINGVLKKTPHQNPLIFPTRQLAELYRDEFEFYQGKFPKDSLLMQQLIYTALDFIAVDRAGFIEDLLNYATTDLLLYQAHYPQDLVERQKRIWDPYIEWASGFLSMAFTPGFDLQARTIDRSKLECYLDTLDAFSLSGFYTAVELCHSFVLGLSFVNGHKLSDEICEAALLHETYQQEQWGQSQEALLVRKRLRKELSLVDSFLCALKEGEYVS